MKKNLNKKFSLSVKILLLVVMGFLTTGFISVSASSYNENDRINGIVEDLIEEGKLPKWHSYYLSYAPYHTLFLKHYESTDPTSMDYFREISEENMITILNRYALKANDLYYIIDNLQVPVKYLEPGVTVGLMFNGQDVMLVWTSQYIPNELLNLSSVTVKTSKGTIKYDNKMEIDCEGKDDFPSFETITICYEEESNIQLNLSYIGGYRKCNKCGQNHKYGVNLSSGEVTIEGWTTELDRFQDGKVYDPNGYYKFACATPLTLNLSTDYSYGGKSTAQFLCHRFIEITDIECQSSYDANFRGYKHLVFFNTNIDIEQIYRVDVGYMLRAQDEKWTAQLVNNTKDRYVLKSLSAEKQRGGLFNLFKYQGFTEGDYASHVDNAVHYKYRMHLNYDEGAWEWDTVFDDDHREKDYTRIQQFQILRLNFLYLGEEFDVPVDMDTVNGQTVSIFDRDQILNTSSVIWEFKETVIDTVDRVDDVIDDLAKGEDSKVVKVIKSIATVCASALVIYIGYKGFIIIKKYTKGKNNET